PARAPQPRHQARVHRLAGPERGVGRGRRDGAHPDQQVPRGHGRDGDGGRYEHVGWAVALLHDGGHGDFHGRGHRCSTARSPSGSGYWKTASSGTPKTWAIWNAISRDGEYLPFSIAMTVCRVTPIRSASSAWVISSWAKRKERIALVTLVRRPTPTALGGRRRA